MIKNSSVILIYGIISISELHTVNEGKKIGGRNIFVASNFIFCPFLVKEIFPFKSFDNPKLLDANSVNKGL